MSEVWNVADWMFFSWILIGRGGSFTSMLRMSATVCDVSMVTSVNLNKQPRPVSILLKGLIKWLVHIHYNPKTRTKTEYSTFTSSHDRFSLILYKS
jgi:hypothetical protein